MSAPEYRSRYDKHGGAFHWLGKVAVSAYRSRPGGGYTMAVGINGLTVAHSMRPATLADAHAAAVLSLRELAGEVLAMADQIEAATVGPG